MVPLYLRSHNALAEGSDKQLQLLFFRKLDIMTVRSAPFPDPEDYGVSPKYGFLSPDAPATAFKDPYYQPWDDLIARLSTLISGGELEKAVGALPLLNTSKLRIDVEHRRAYVLLAFLIHGYVWCRSPPNRRVPPQLAEPFLEVCATLGMEPVLSYAGLCSWNWCILNDGGMTLENMQTLANFTGTRGEAAFYHVPVLIEAEGGHLVHLLLDAMKEAQQGRPQVVVDALNETKASLVRMGAHLSKFYGTLEPHFFYHQLRPFLAGGNGMEEKGLPNGMILQRSDGSEKALKLVGGSAAQSSLFPFLDLALGVKHEDRTVFDVGQICPQADDR